MELFRVYEVGDFVRLNPMAEVCDDLKPCLGKICKITNIIGEDNIKKYCIDCAFDLQVGKTCFLWYKSELIPVNPSDEKEGYIDISNEKFRSYHFPLDHDQMFSFGVNNPRWLKLCDDRSHVIVDENGLNHFVPFGWVGITSRLKDDDREFIGG